MTGVARGACIGFIAACTRSATCPPLAKAAGWPPCWPAGAARCSSHRSAATLWRIRDGEGPSPDVTASAHRPVSEEVASHRAALLAADRDHRFGIPVAGPGRTLADLAHVLPLDDLVRAFREAQFLRLYDRAALIEVLKRRPSRRLKELMEDAAITQTEMEDAFKRICLAPPVSRCRGRSTGFGAKAYDFASARLPPDPLPPPPPPPPPFLAFQADRTTSNKLQLKGWMILRFTWKDSRRAHAVWQPQSRTPSGHGRSPAPRHDDRLALARPRRHRDADGRQRRRPMRAELEARPHRDREAVARHHVDHLALIIARRQPHLAAPGEEEPDLVDRPVHDGRENLATRQLEVGTAAALGGEEHPHVGAVRCGGGRGGGQSHGLP